MRRVRNRIRDSLFLKIYLTLLACLAAVAIASAIYWSSSSKQDGLSWRNRFQTFVERMVPAAESQAELQKALDRLGRASDARLALYGPDGALVAAHGPAMHKLPGHRESGWRDFSGGFAIPLSDGRVLSVALNQPLEGDGRSVFVYLLVIAAVVGMIAYPVVRHLTRRLERLRAGVEQFGAGALAVRVPVEGGDEVAAVAGSFNAAARRIEQLVESHRSLLANASHELRSPLARLRMAVDLYDGSDERQGKEIIANLGEIDALVEEILLASRLNHVGGLEQTVRLDLTALAAEECALHGVPVSGRPAELKGDPRLLKRMIRNLALNALKHGKPPVTVEVGMADGKAVLTIRDHGPGLPGGEEERVFEAFYRPSGRSEAGGGWGLGLALVKQIAELHGGTVRYENADGGGARFVVKLPKGT